MFHILEIEEEHMHFKSVEINRPVMQARNYNPQKAHGLNSLSINRNHFHPLNRSKQ